MWREGATQGDAMKRVGQLAGLLVLVLGSGVVAQEPEPTPLFAPDDLALTLPTHLDGMRLSVLSYIGQDSLMLAKGQIRPVLEQVLSDLDKTPDELRMAAAWRDMDDPSGRAMSHGRSTIPRAKSSSWSTSPAGSRWRTC
jgi:hypothetical protein